MTLSGLLLIHKPAGYTSTAVTGRVKKMLRTFYDKPPKAGHMGTLDPFATGLLPIAIGCATRLLPWTTHHMKSYRFTVKWGTETDTLDLTGAVLKTSEARPSRAEIEGVLPLFRGHILQMPPRFSALKVQGERAYTLARRGEDFALGSRPQTISRFELLETHADWASFDVTGNTGTYVRSLGRDLAQALGTCGHLTELTRTAIGPWDLNRAIPLDSLDRIAHDEAGLRTLLIKPRALLDDIPALEVEEKEAGRLIQGLSLERDTYPLDTVVACVQNDFLVALVRQKEGLLAPFRVFKKS